MMEAGKLRHLVTVQVNSPTQDAMGHPVESWTSSSTAYASIEPMSGRELATRQGLTSTVSHRIRMRYLSLTPQQRITFGARVFAVNVVRNIDERSAEIEALCTEQI